MKQRGWFHRLGAAMTWLATAGSMAGAALAAGPMTGEEDKRLLYVMVMGACLLLAAAAAFFLWRGGKKRKDDADAHPGGEAPQDTGDYHGKREK